MLQDRGTKNNKTATTIPPVTIVDMTLGELQTWLGGKEYGCRYRRAEGGTAHPGGRSRSSSCRWLLRPSVDVGQHLAVLQAHSLPKIFESVRPPISFLIFYSFLLRDTPTGTKINLYLISNKLCNKKLMCNKKKEVILGIVNKLIWLFYLPSPPKLQ